METTQSVQIGEIYMDKVSNQKTIFPNKTRKYLLPCLREYGDTFISKLNSVFKVAVGIGDVIVNSSGVYHEKHLFILVDTTVANKFFIEFLDYIRDMEMYEDDYVFGNIQKTQLHMFVIVIPDKFHKSFEHWKIGEYSKMYDEESIRKFFENHPKTKRVLVKDHDYKIYFTEKVNAMFGSWVKPEEWEGESDFPPAEHREIFNHHLKK